MLTVMLTNVKESLKNRIKNKNTKVKLRVKPM